MSSFGDPRLRQAQRLAAEADRVLRGGDLPSATALYAEAAPLEAAVAREVPADRPRVRGVIATSAVTLWYKAGRYAEAQHLAAEFLADPVVAQVAEIELREIIARCEPRTLPPPRVVHLSDLHFSGAPPRSPGTPPAEVIFPPPTRISHLMQPLARRRHPLRRHREVA